MRCGMTTPKAIARGLVCAALLLLGATPAAAQQKAFPTARVAFVDFQKAIDLSLRGKLARKELQRTVSARQQRIEGLSSELKQLENDYKEKAGLLEGSEWDDYKARFGFRVKELRREGEDIQDEVARAERRLTEELLGELTVLVQRYAREKGYTLVLEKKITETLYQGPGLDLTDKLIELYDSGALFETKEKP